MKSRKCFRLPPAPVYHYCSVEALLGILSSSSIFLTHCRYQNDHMESKWIRSIIKRLQDKRMYQFDGWLLSEIEKLLLSYQGDAYLGCFSENKDVLSQWRAYADDGYGVSIGFNIEMIADKFPLSLRYKKIHYYEESQVREVADILMKNTLKINAGKQMQEGYLEQSIERLFNREKVTLADVRAEKIFKSEDLNEVVRCARELFILSHFIKSNAFFEECERRLCLFPDRVKITDDHHFFDELNHRCINKRIVPFYQFYFTDYKYILKEMVFGPRCKLDEYSIRSVLKKFEFKNVKISRSNASYR